MSENRQIIPEVAAAAKALAQSSPMILFALAVVALTFVMVWQNQNWMQDKILTRLSTAETQRREIHDKLNRILYPLEREGTRRRPMLVDPPVTER